MEQHCKLCSNIINDQSFTVVKCDEQEIFDILLLKLNFENTIQYVFCGSCSEILFGAVNFKSTCLDTDNTIILYVDFANPLPVNLRDIYREENEIKDTSNISHDERICRLCMQPIDVEYISIGDIPVEIIDIYIPELNLNVTIDPVICKKCYDSLYTYSSFIKKCNNVEEKIDETIVNETPSYGYIKTEEIHIKSDESDYMEEESVELSFSDTKSNKIEEENDDWQSETEYKNNFQSVQLDDDPYEVQMYKCGEFHFETEHKSDLKTCELIQKEPCEVQMYKCEESQYETEFEQTLQAHQLVHTNPSVVKMYKCDKCQYECKRMCTFKLHQSTHKSPSKMYKCDDCHYETKSKRYLRSHQLKHKDCSEVRVYKCEECPYETEQGHHFKSHQSVHKAKVYKCDKCEYKAKKWVYFKNHRTTHEDSSKVPVYKCEKCGFQTKYKKSLTVHQFKHKTPSEGNQYKCDGCHFKCRTKRELIKHKCAQNVQN